MTSSALSIALLAATFAGHAAVAQIPVPGKSRQFDFWIGAWNVNLRVQHDDGTWHDDIQATEYSYPILDGKAILELWAETSHDKNTIGYSVRYYRADIDQWELWLNWPQGENQSGSGRLRGGFRHNRGEFVSESKKRDSTTLTARFTFSDISPQSFRWDDAYSSDGGKTWTNSWIMEFTRIADVAPALSVSTPANTYGPGKLCGDPPFKEFDQLNGERIGTMRYRDGVNDGWKTSTATLTTHRILGGCASISFLEFARDGAIYKRFSHNTYNTVRHAFEVGELDNAPNATYQAFFGQKANGQIDLRAENVDTKAPTDHRSVWTITNDTFQFEDDRLIDGVWISVGQGAFHRAR